MIISRPVSPPPCRHRLTKQSALSNEEESHSGIEGWVDQKLDKSKRKYYNKRRKRMYGSDSDDDSQISEEDKILHSFAGSNVLEGRMDFIHCLWKARRLVKVQKVGHAGTLDPMATGLLIVCVGKATKVVDRFQGMIKGYSGVFRLGRPLQLGMLIHRSVSPSLVSY
ncbi:hypothetical protein IFM89_027314 [Coptis chinensis]|uniref:tRNA pseudouridine(55) synthase n=1 Tax=Coptis chinensis TaxID=261450 RepID=A0A835HYC9_9MAGN|nr:hypothetical protein IFM89_027314 [Coptis chinensis]